MSVTITIPSDTPLDLNFTSFYELCAKKAGYTVTPLTNYDCRKIVVAKNIIDAIFDGAEREGVDRSQTAMAIVMCGPKGDETMHDWTVVLEDSFAFEKPFDVKEAIQGILQSDDEGVLVDITQAFYEQADNDDELWSRKGRDMLRAYLDDSVDDFCAALTGWSLENILKRAGAIPDYDQTFHQE